MKLDNSYDYNYTFQHTLLNLLLSDPESFGRCRNILKEDYFDANLRKAVSFILSYSDQYSIIPSPDIIIANTSVEFSKIDDASSHNEWILDNVEKFCRYRAIENVVLDGTDLLNKGMAGDLESRLKDAMTISLMSDLGSDFLDTVHERMDRLRDRKNIIATGWKAIDKKLYGGVSKGSLLIFAGGSGSGKSLFLQNLALNWLEAGMNVIYISLELSEDLVSNRLDSMTTGLSTKDIFSKPEELFLRAKIYKNKHTNGSLYVKKMPEAGTTCNDIRAYIKEYQIKTGLKVDALIIDYLDLVHPNSAKMDITNAFHKDKAVSEEMRAIGGDLNIPVASASQLNRSSVDATEFDHSHIAGGISKINTADNVLAIFTSPSLREKGKYKLQFLKTRSSSAVGTDILLGYFPKFMRIVDDPEYEDTDDEYDDEIDETVKVDDSKKNLDDMFETLRKN